MSTENHFYGNFEMQNVVTKELTIAEIENIANITMEAFDVSHEDIRAEVSYKAFGILELSLSDEASIDDIVDVVPLSLSTLLGIHPRDIVVTSVNLESGEVQYEVSSENFARTSDVQFILDSLSRDDIEVSIQGLLPSIAVNSNNVDNNIEVYVSVIADGSDAGNIREARNVVESILMDLGYDVTNFIYASHTVSYVFFLR